MGLAIVVGMLAELRQLDEKGARDFRETLDAVNDLLRRAGLPPHNEPETLPPLENRCEEIGFPYSFLHYLRRAYAHHLQNPGWRAAPFDESKNPARDALVEKHSRKMQSHLLCHSDAEGFHVPIDFKPMLVDDGKRIPGALVGSSYRLREELVAVAPALGIALNGTDLPDAEVAAISRDALDETGVWRERLVWLALFEAARLSIEHRAAIYST